MSEGKGPSRIRLQAVTNRLAFPPDPGEGETLALLAAKAGGGDPRAVERLLECLEARVRRWLTARVGEFREPDELAGDLSQEALIRIAGAVARARFHTDGQVVSWALTIGRNVLVDHLRADGERGAHTGADVENAASSEALLRWGAGPDVAGPAQRLMGGVVRQALAPLSDAARELLRLRVQAGATWKEVADELHTTEAGAKRRYQRLQGTLRREIIRRLKTQRREGSPGAEACLRRLGEPPADAGL